MNVVDSSAWLEYFADGPNAESFADESPFQRDFTSRRRVVASSRETTFRIKELY